MQPSYPKHALNVYPSLSANKHDVCNNWIWEVTEVHKFYTTTCNERLSFSCMRNWTEMSHRALLTDKCKFNTNYYNSYSTSARSKWLSESYSCVFHFTFEQPSESSHPSQSKHALTVYRSLLAEPRNEIHYRDNCVTSTNCKLLSVVKWLGMYWKVDKETSKIAHTGLILETFPERLPSAIGRQI